MKTFLSIFLLLFAISAWAAPVGEIAMLKGDASIVRGGKTIAAKVQLPIMAQDLINTQKNGKLQLIFTDNTVITLGASSSFSIADYLFDEQNSRANFSVSSGSFKVITGRIGKLAPKSFLLKTKTSLIGIRGTIFAGDVGVTSAEGNGDLLACLKGSISVQSLRNSSTVTIDHGKMVFVDNAGNLGAVRHMDSNTLPKFSNVQTQPSQHIHQQEMEEVDTKASSEVEHEKIDNLNKIHQYIADKKTVNYRGNLTGESEAIIKDNGQKISTLELDAKIKADMDMSVDFGGNDPLKIKLGQQQIEFTEVKQNGTKIDPAAYNAVANTLDMNLEANMQLPKPRIDADNHKIEAFSSKTINGLTKDVQLKGEFNDASGNAISGELNEQAKGSLGANKTIDREIETNFNVQQLNK